MNNNFLVLFVFFLVSEACLVHGVRIIGGKETSIKDFPSAASLQRNGQHVCGATILSPKTLLTAAHCIKPFSVKSLSVRVGSEYHAKGGQTRTVASIKIHPDFNQLSLNYDVGLLYLKSPLQFSETVSSIQFAKSDLFDAPHIDMNATIIGWGSVIQDGGVVAKLRSAKIKIIPRRRCKKIYGTQLRLTMFCAGALSGAKDACQGDSGGGLYVGDEVAGIVSWGSGCANKKYPGIYTWVSRVSYWLLNNVEKREG